MSHLTLEEQGFRLTLMAYSVGAVTCNFYFQDKESHKSRLLPNFEGPKVGGG